MQLFSCTKIFQLRHQFLCNKYNLLFLLYIICNLYADPIAMSDFVKYSKLFNMYASMLKNQNTQNNAEYRIFVKCVQDIARFMEGECGLLNIEVFFIYDYLFIFFQTVLLWIFYRFIRLN